MSEKKSFFEKLGKSLKLEDEALLDDELENEEDTTNPFKDEATSEIPDEMPVVETPQDYTPAEEEGENAMEGVSEESLEQDGGDSEEDMFEDQSMGPTTTLAVASTTRRRTKTKPKKQATRRKTSTRRDGEEAEEGQLTIDVYDTENAIIIKSTIAGVDSEDLDIDITQDSVSIRGTREKDEEVRGEDYFYHECYWGAFSRSIILPTEINADKATAGLKNGILTIRLPKLSRAQQKKLKVRKE